MANDLDVLIVDDDQNMRATLAEILSQDGYRVRTASTGEEAVELCRHLRFRLILMDVRMPGIDGIEAFRQIRTHCKRSQIVLMSAYSSEALEKAAAAEGALAFLAKPIEIEVVAKLIAEVTSTSVLFVGRAQPVDRTLYDGLARQGYRTNTAATIEEALALSDQIGFDAVVLDVEAQPQAEAAYRALRERLPHCLIVVLAPPATGVRAPARTASEPAVLEKPVQVEDLVALLEPIKCDRLGLAPPPSE